MAAQDRIRLTGQLPRGLPATGALSSTAPPWSLEGATRCGGCHHADIHCVLVTSHRRERRRLAPPAAAGRMGRLASVRRTCEHVFVIVCVLIPRFSLAVAAGGREAL